jgi:predicted nucleic acid-binding protein
MSALLLDSNVWVASLDPTDRNHAAAQQLVADVTSGRALAALDLTLYEVANVAVRTWRSPEDAHTLVRLVRDACPSMIAVVDERLIDRAVEVAELHRISIYDASYVAAAELHGWTLVSGDHSDLVRPGLAIAPDAAAA